MIVDTSILIAAINARDRYHGHAKRLLGGSDLKVVVEAVVVETDWLVLRRFGVDAEIAFLRSLTEGSLVVESCSDDDRARVVELVDRYRDASLGYVDAAVVAVAERLRERTIATLDRRDFSIVRPSHVETFELVP